MRLMLMHQNVPVLEYEYISEAGAIVGVYPESANLEHAPLRVYNERIARMGDLTESLVRSMNRWWRARRVPNSRPASPYMRELTANKTNDDLLFGTLALSLSDQYWVQPADMPYDWKEVNYFDNDFDTEIGKALAGIKPASANASPYDPSCSANGQLPKMWTIDQSGTRQLLKSGSGALQQEPINELIATKLYERLLVEGDYVSYSLRATDGRLYSACPCMVTRDEDLITADEVFKSSLYNSGSMDYGELIQTARQTFAVDWQPLIDRMLVCDYILGNIDRHGGNFCLVRNASTLNEVRSAPIFDNGLSMLCYQPDQPQNVVEMMANPFAVRQATQLALVTDLSWFDASKLKGFTDEVVNLLPLCHNRYMDNERMNYLQAFVESGVRTVECYADELPRLKELSRTDRSEQIKEIRRASLRELQVPEVFVASVPEPPTQTKANQVKPVSERHRSSKDER